MVEIINLRQQRKQKAREEREKAASANRALFGRSKAAKQKASAEEELARRKLEGHRMDET